MKNDYLIDGDRGIIFINHKGEQMEVIVDISTLYELIELKISWWGHRSNNNHIYAIGHNLMFQAEPRAIKMHQLIMGFPKIEEGLLIDHINRNALDNRKQNLRVVTRVENARNSDISKHNTSGVKGVHYCKTTQRWIARIRVNGKRKHLGIYEKKQDAIKCREKAELNYWN